jgi:hypothetical protein
MHAEDTTTYNFETINFPGDTFTQTLGINNSDRIAGYHGATLNRGFTLVLFSKAFTNENFPGSAQTQVIAINNSSKTAGFYIDAAGNTHGFTDQRGSFLKVDFPGTPFNQLLGQNDSGQAAGYYSTKADGTGPDHAYIFDEFGSVFELLNIPASTSAQATGINNSGNVCGFASSEAKLGKKVIWRSWERSTKTISSRSGKTRRTGSALSNSCPPIIQRPGSLLPRSLGTWLAMQIARTHARWYSSVILTPALTSFYFPFRLLRKKTSS